MIVRVEAPFVDLRGDTLRWSLGLPRRAALAARTVSLPDGRIVELNVLGASHQVLVRRTDALLLSETVSCDLEAATPLPGRVRIGAYRFGTRVERLDDVSLKARVEGLIEWLDDRPDAIVAEFPGAPFAVTGVALRRTGTGLTWQTWHSYPQTGELVRTMTELDHIEEADG